MKYKYQGNFKELYVKAIDNVPVGTEVDYIGNTVPQGWEQVADPNEYSTTEKVVGKWINNKPIYRKVIQLPNVQNGELDISSWNIDEFISCIASQNSGSYISFFNLYTGSSNINYITFNVNNGVTKLVYRQGSSQTITVILEYTKTTDTV